MTAEKSDAPRDWIPDDPMDRATMFADLYERKTEIKAELAAVEEKMNVLEEEVLEFFVEKGLQNLQTANGFTVYLHTQVWASYPNGRPAAVEALARAGHGELVREDFNHHQVSALVREHLEQDGTLPAEFGDDLTFFEKFSARARKA